MKKYWLVNTENLNEVLGNVHSQRSKLCQLNIMGIARQALVFRKDFLGNPVKWFLKE